MFQFAPDRTIGAPSSRCLEPRDRAAPRPERCHAVWPRRPISNFSCASAMITRSPSSVQSGTATSQALGTRHSHGNWLWLLPDLLKEQGQGTQVYAHSRIYRVRIFNANQTLQGAFWRFSFPYCNPVPQQKDTCASRFLTYLQQVNPVVIYSHSCSLPRPVQVPS